MERNGEKKHPSSRVNKKIDQSNQVVRKSEGEIFEKRSFKVEMKHIQQEESPPGKAVVATSALASNTAAAASPAPLKGAMAGTGTSAQEAFVGLLSGAAFGMVSPIVGHPFDLVKTKMQACSSVRHDATLRQTIVQIYRNDGGIRGFYKGFVPPLIGSIAFRSLQFSVYSGTYAFCERHSPLLHTPLPYTGGLQPSVLMGAFAASLARAVLETPLEFIKIQVMVGKTNALFPLPSSSSTAGRRIVVTSATIHGTTTATAASTVPASTARLIAQGLRSLTQHPVHTLQHLYHGFTPTLFRTMGLLGSFFVLADYSVRYIPQVVNAPLIGPFFKGGVCATLAWCVCFPLESAKSVLQADHTGRYKNQRFATWQVLKQLYREKGIRNGLYRGFGPGASRSFVANGVSMIVYSMAQDALRPE